MHPEYRKRLCIALMGAAVGVYAIAYGLGFMSDAPKETATRSITAYATQQSDDSGSRALYGIEPIKAEHGALSWDLFGAVKEKTQQQSTPISGFPNAYTFLVTPIFTSEIKKYDGQQVKIMGYMFPLEGNKLQKHFLMGPYTPTCAMHYHAPNNQVIDVKSDWPIPFTWEPILVEGTLILNNDPNNSFYRLEKTRFIKEYPEKSPE